MQKRIAAVCAAALGLALPGCDERPPQKPKRVEAPRVAPRAAPAPLVTEIEIADAGVIEVDALALDHDDRGRNVDHLGRAQKLRDEGDFEGALAEVRRALHDEPGDEEVLGRVERLAQLAGQHELRLVALSRIAELLPDDAAPLIRKGRLLLALGRPDEAIVVGTLAATRDAKDPEAHHLIGRGYLTLGDLPRAIQSFEEVLALQSDHGYALNNLGFAYLRANRNDDAVEVLTRAAAQLPNVAYVHNNLGVALERVGEIDEAKEAYAQASFLSPKYVKAQVNTARLARLAQSVGVDGGQPLDTAVQVDVDSALEGLDVSTPPEE